MKTKKFKQDRKWWFRFIKKLNLIRYKKPEFIYLGEKPTNSSIIISNHVGTDAPMSLELFADFPVKMWTTCEMNSGLKKLYAYQTKVYYHEKKHWNLTLARLFCLLASPLTNLFYSGLQPISTYKDARFLKTIKQSKEAIIKGENIVIFPEMSDEGYLAKLKGFYSGFIVFAQKCFDDNIDLPIFVSFFHLKQKKYVFDAPIKYSQLKNNFSKREQMINYLLEKCNALGEMQF